MRFDSTDSGWKIVGPLVRLPKGKDENPCYGKEMTIVSYGVSEDSKAVLRIATSKSMAEMPSAIMAMSGPKPASSGTVPVMSAPMPAKVRCDPQPKSTEFGPDGELICTCYAWEGTDCNNEKNLDVICITCNHDEQHRYGSSKAGECQDSMPPSMWIFGLLLSGKGGPA